MVQFIASWELFASILFSFFLLCATLIVILLVDTVDWQYAPLRSGPTRPKWSTAARCRLIKHKVEWRAQINSPLAFQTTLTDANPSALPFVRDLFLHLKQTHTHARARTHTHAHTHIRLTLPLSPPTHWLSPRTQNPQDPLPNFHACSLNGAVSRH